MVAGLRLEVGEGFNSLGVRGTARQATVLPHPKANPRERYGTFTHCATLGVP